MHDILSRVDRAVRLVALGDSLGDKIAVASSFLRLPAAMNVRVEGTSFPIVIRSGADRTVMQEMLVLDEYRLAEQPDPPVIIDIGANVGFSSIYFSARFPKAVIHAIEPAPATYARLVENTKSIPNIVTHNLALGGEDGQVAFFVQPLHFGSSLIEREGSSPVQVRAQKLDTFLREQEIDQVGLLKFDIEGAEVDLFGGMANPSRVKQFVGEVHYDLISEGPQFFRNVLSDFDVVERPSGTRRTILNAKRA